MEPQRREAMLEGSDGLTAIPQLHVNGRYIGGADEVQVGAALPAPHALHGGLLLDWKHSCWQTCNRMPDREPVAKFMHCAEQRSAAPNHTHPVLPWLAELGAWRPVHCRSLRTGASSTLSLQARLQKKWQPRLLQQQRQRLGCQSQQCWRPLWLSSQQQQQLQRLQQQHLRQQL